MEELKNIEKIKQSSANTETDKETPEGEEDEVNKEILKDEWAEEITFTFLLMFVSTLSKMMRCRPGNQMWEQKNLRCV